MGDLFRQRVHYKCYDGTYVKQTPVGYCTYSKHRGFLTKNMMNEKKCLSKCCPSLVKNTEHPFWSRRNRIKAEKIARKNGKSTYEFDGHTYSVR